VDLRRQLGRLEFPDRPHHLLTVGEQPIALKRPVVGTQHSAERVRQRSGVEQLVLHDVDAFEERRDRCEQPVVGIELSQLQALRLPRQERRELVVVQHVVRFVSGHALL